MKVNQKRKGNVILGIFLNYAYVRSYLETKTCMKTSFCNYFITTNTMALTKPVSERPYRALPKT